MIQVNELRIGNWLKNFLGEYFEANATTISSFESGIHPFGAPQSITLTPELLEQCGFIQGKDNSKIWYHPSTMLFELMNVTALESGFKIVAGRHTDGFFVACTIEIKYLHQLQNIYFALTGQELEINLKTK